MTKLEHLNSILTSRLMATLDEIMHIVGGTVQEYVEEVSRVRRENQCLKERLRKMENCKTYSQGPIQLDTFVQYEICPDFERKTKLIEFQQSQSQNQTLTEQHRSSSNLHIKHEADTCIGAPLTVVPESQPTTGLIEPEPLALISSLQRVCANDSPETLTITTSLQRACTNDSLRSANQSKETAETITLDYDVPEKMKEEPIETSDSAGTISHRISTCDTDVHSGNPVTCPWRSPQSMGLESDDTSEISSLAFSTETSQVPTALPEYVCDRKIRCTNKFRYHRECCELRRRKIAKSSPVWQFFSLKDGDCSRAVCSLCQAELSRGRKEYTTSALLKHLRMKHKKCCYF